MLNGTILQKILIKIQYVLFKVDCLTNFLIYPENIPVLDYTYCRLYLPFTARIMISTSISLFFFIKNAKILYDYKFISTH